MRSVLLRIGVFTVFLALLLGTFYVAVQNQRGQIQVQKQPDKSEVILYDQYNNAIWWGPPGDSEGQAADDFVVPVDQTWVINQVEVAGIYFDTYFDNSEHGAQSVNVEYYQDADSLPGAQISAQKSLTYTLFPSDSAEAQVVATPATPDTNYDRTRGSFVISIDPVTLASGTYWLSVWANMSDPYQLGHMPRWVWVARQVTANHTTAFRSETGFGGCRTWGYLADCSVYPEGSYDLVFRLKGNILSGAAATGTPTYGLPSSTPIDIPTPTEPTSTPTPTPPSDTDTPTNYDIAVYR
jgi:hypothetical protein